MDLSYEGVCFDLFGTLVSGEGVAFAGVRAALERLPAQRWAIVTSCGEALALAMIARAQLPVPKTLVSADDVDRGKPAPDPYALGARRLGNAPERLLVIEDSREGIASARAAGMDVIAIARGRGSTFACDAIAHVDRFEEIEWFVADDGSIRVRL
ncbi:MAG TPA: HAD-IA family hydrolase [Candidatus Baltobacteraceae bacterium]|nr:HAD-IA family hydrolase [Candidatus Baltobacteraceae bacterium]